MNAELHVPLTNGLVSIVMPCYHALNTLQRSVSGVQSQTYSNWELLLIVDGSVDGTVAVAQTLARQDDRIRLVVSGKNRGVSRCRNLGIRLSKGSWIAFCDSDDLWLPHKLADQMNLAVAEQAQLVCSGFSFYYPANGVKLPVHTRKIINYGVMLHTNAIPLSTAMFSVSELGRCYFPEMPSPYIHEDYAFWLRMFQKCNPKVGYLESCTIEITQVAGSRSANKWLSMRSHGYILKSVAKVGGLRWGWLMLNYVWHGSLKRILGKWSRET
jgi:hypothetical protein